MLLLYILGANVVRFTPLHLFESFWYFLGLEYLLIQKYKSIIKSTLTCIYRLRYPAAGCHVIQMNSKCTSCDKNTSIFTKPVTQ